MSDDVADSPEDRLLRVEDELTDALATTIDLALEQAFDLLETSIDRSDLSDESATATGAAWTRCAARALARHLGGACELIASVTGRARDEVMEEMRAELEKGAKCAEEAEDHADDDAEDGGGEGDDDGGNEEGSRDRGEPN